MDRKLLAALLAAFAVQATHAADEVVPPCSKNHYILVEPCAVPAQQAAIGPVGALAFSPDGVLHFSVPSVVLKLEANGDVTRVAGTGRHGFSGDGGPALEAAFDFGSPAGLALVGMWEVPTPVAGLAFDPAGQLHIADVFNNRVRVVDRAGIVSTRIGGQMKRADDLGLQVYSGIWWPQLLAFESDGGFYVSGSLNSLLRVPAEDAAVEQIADPLQSSVFLLEPDGRMLSPGACGIYRVTRQHEVTLVAGVKGPYCRWDDPHRLRWPSSMASDDDGAVYLAEASAHCIRKLTPAGFVTVAGQCGDWGDAAFAGDGGPATEARLSSPRGLAIRDGVLYIADTGNKRIRRVDRDGIITTIAGNGEALPQPEP